jgi:hypothetical protein
VCKAQLAVKEHKVCKEFKEHKVHKEYKVAKVFKAQLAVKEL